MPHASFRTTLLLTVLLIAGALGAAAASGWIMLQDFARASREAGSGALNLTTAMQQIDERSLDMARSARQYAVLRDDGLRHRYDEAQAQALASLATMTASLPQIAQHADTWRRTEAQLRAVFDLPAEAAVGDALPDLASINDRLAAGVREAIDGRNTALLDTLESSRDTLATQVLAAIALALLLAVATGWWILRPLKRVEQAIARLGEGQFSMPVRVGGPADLRRLGEKLEWLRVRLADLEAHRNRVLRHVSHELKTPLASLREGIALLQDGVTGQLSDEQIEVSGILDANARALQERIEQLIGYNATQFDARHLELKPTALRALAREVAADLKLQAQAKDIRLDVSGYAPPVRGDAAKLRIALTNLLSNGIAFSPHGGTVRLELSSDGDTTRIDCIDEGPGVAPDETERIFEPFFRGSRRAPRPDKGNGLGLAIVREFIAAHGGRALVLPAERGAHFRIELPHAS
ncbi:ATP-binding protein [Methyloversatilis discipulorum]|uniref:HAMP domain-containing sensor histidine kinase n=1 Tax=Methyloversatilis discipulorum TaxID=1119528 RepID=UPI00035EA821|nr:ATP-binding protein [Methyloversatilis discipulorum]